MSGHRQRPDPDSILMGRIGAAHGLGGEVRLISFTQDPLAIATYGPLSTSRPGLVLTIDKLRWPGTRQKSDRQATLVAKLAGVNDRNAAESLKGLELFVPKDRIPPSSEEEGFLHVDLIGLEARLQDGTVLGKIVSVPNFGAGDLLEIAQKDSKTILLAFTRKNVPRIDIEQGFVSIILPKEISGEKTG